MAKCRRPKSRPRRSKSRCSRKRSHCRDCCGRYKNCKKYVPTYSKKRRCRRNACKYGTRPGCYRCRRKCSKRFKICRVCDRRGCVPFKGACARKRSRRRKSRPRRKSRCGRSRSKRRTSRKSCKCKKGE